MSEKKVLLETRNLKKYFRVQKQSLLHAVDDVNLQIRQGETLGVVGESGCGKSTLGRTILRLLPATSGEVLYEGENVLQFRGRQLKKMRVNMQMIFQDPFTSLNPRLSVSNIIAEPIKVCKIASNKREMDNKVRELMDICGLHSRYVNMYPHELDGGQRQRVGLARALAVNPNFIVCDEPVSALDVSIQAQILNLIMDLQAERGVSYMFITHDLCVVRHVSHEIMVMYLGKVVEYTTSKRLFSSPLHPYTQALLSAIPTTDLNLRHRKREFLTGEVANPIDPKPGCRFMPRCPHAGERCREPQELIEVELGHKVACWRVREVGHE